MVTIFREEGPAALYKGFVPKVLRLAPGGGVLLLVVEFTLGVFRQGNILFFDLSSRLLRSSFPSTWTSIYIGTRGELEAENDIHSPNLFDTAQ